jgi:hypothetical protein
LVDETVFGLVPAFVPDPAPHNITVAIHIKASKDNARLGF